MFKVLEWNSSGGEYLDLLNTPDLFFDPGEDRYVSEQLLLTDENEGNSRLWSFRIRKDMKVPS